MFSSKNQLYNHRRSVHQTKASVKYTSGPVHLVKDGDNWLCYCDSHIHGHPFKDIGNLRKHARTVNWTVCPGLVH
jgi:hypothetical protein